MKFGEAIDAMMGGGAVRRVGWNAAYGKGVTYKASEEFGDPLLFMTLNSGQVLAWSPSHRDIIADDWEAALV